MEKCIVNFSLCSIPEANSIESAGKMAARVRDL